MFLTRCPACETTFRMTREQLLARDGKVRCGACRHIFNALEHLLEEEPAVAQQQVAPAPIEVEFPQAAPPEDHQALTLPQEPEPEALPEPIAEFQAEPVAQDDIQPPLIQLDAFDPAPSTEQPPPEAESSTPPQDPIDAALAEDSPEEIKQQGLENGLLAARDLTEIPGFSRWSASPLEGVASAPTPRALWPFLLVALLLALALTAQAAYHFRGPLSRQMPLAAEVFSKLSIQVPLARESEWISIEASDLQSLPEPGHLQLLATLRNRLPHAQAWPQLELSLTDTYDMVLVRKVFSPEEYLPKGAPDAFVPGDMPLTLNLDAGKQQPAGYRLYVFYP